MDVVQISGYLLCLPAVGAFWVQWRQNSEQKKKLLQLEELFCKRTQELERVQKEWEASLGLDRNRSQKWGQLEKQVKEAKAKAQELLEQQELLKEAHEKELRGRLEKVEDKEQQIETLLRQLKEQDQQAQFLQKKVKEVERAAAVQLEQMEAKSKSSIKGQFHELNTMRAENRKLESQLQQAQKTYAAASVDVEQGKRLKKQLAQYRYFNQTVSSQGEMLEERLQNWETALKGLATAVCQDKKVQVPTTLGPLIGTALELLNQSQLVVDDQDFTPHGTVCHAPTIAI